LKTEPIGELISILFLSRDIAHREHLTTDSYAQHMALGSFYEDIVGLADSLAETYQGCTGTRISDIPYYSNPMKGNILVTLKKMHSRVEELRTQILPDESPIQNIIDEVDALYYSTIYKLTFLK
jgi:hypothetical protein